MYPDPTGTASRHEQDAWLAAASSSPSPQLAPLLPRLLRSPSGSRSQRGWLGAPSCGVPGDAAGRQRAAGAGPSGVSPTPPALWGRARPLPPRPRAWSQVQTASPSAAAERDAAGGRAGGPQCLRGSMVSVLGLGEMDPEPPAPVGLGWGSCRDGVGWVLGWDGVWEGSGRGWCWSAQDRAWSSGAREHDGARTGRGGGGLAPRGLRAVRMGPGSG